MDNCFHQITFYHFLYVCINVLKFYKHAEKGFVIVKHCHPTPVNCYSMWQKADSAAYDALRKKEIEGELRPVDMLNCMKKFILDSLLFKFQMYVCNIKKNKDIKGPAHVTLLSEMFPHTPLWVTV